MKQIPKHLHTLKTTKRFESQPKAPLSQRELTVGNDRDFLFDYDVKSLNDAQKDAYEKTWCKTGLVEIEPNPDTHSTVIKVKLIQFLPP